MAAPHPRDETSSPRTPDAGPGAPATGSGWRYAPAHYTSSDFGSGTPPGGNAYGSTYPSAASGTPPQYTPPQFTPPPSNTPHRKRRTGLVVLAAVLAVALVGGGAALVAKNHTFFTQQDLVTRDDTVTLVVPTDWWDETSSKAGHSEGTGDDYSVTPDVEASSPDETMYVAIWVDRRPEETSALHDAQKEFVDYSCDEAACSSQSKTTSLKINGHDALQQTIHLKADGSYPAVTAILTSILSEHRLVTVYAEGDDDAADQKELAAITAEVLVHD